MVCLHAAWKSLVPLRPRHPPVKSREISSRHRSYEKHYRPQFSFDLSCAGLCLFEAGKSEAGRRDVSKSARHISQEPRTSCRFSCQLGGTLCKRRKTPGGERGVTSRPALPAQL